MLLSIKRNCSRPDFIRFTFGVLIIGVVFLGSCSTRLDGCLEIGAENFNLDADKACESCCKYPTITISLSQKWDNENFLVTDTFFDRNLQPFKIADLKYVLSSFVWKDTDDINYTVDSSLIACGAESIGYTRDIIQVDSRQFFYTLDTIRLYPAIQSLDWKLGWKPELECVDGTNNILPVIFSDASPLWNSNLGSRSAIRLVLQRDISTEIKDTIYIHTCQNLFSSYVDTFDLGKSKVLNLTVNYADWFRLVDITDASSVPGSIIAGLPGSFMKTP